MLTTCLFIIYLAISLILGDVLASQAFATLNYPIKPINRMAASLPLGLAFHLLTAHILALFVTHSYRIAACLSIGLMLLVIIICEFKKYYSLNNLGQDLLSIIKSKEVWVILLGLSIALSCGIRGHLTDSDNIHIPWMAGIVLNNVYPPLLPVNPEHNITFYHYGIDLLCSSIFAIVQAMPWDAISLQVSIGAFCVFLAIYALYDYFFKSFTVTLLATLFTTLFTSIMGLEFVYKFGTKIFQLGLRDFFYYWQQASLPAITHIPYNLVLVSQDMGTAPLLIILLLLCIIKDQGNCNFNFLKIGLPVTLLSFTTYFCYDSYWYVSFAGLGLLFMLEVIIVLIKNKFASKQVRSKLLKFLFFLFCYGIAKFLTFRSGATSFDDINALVIHPTLYWDHFAMQFLNFFPAPDDNHTILPVRDFVSGKIILNVYLWSMVTFRNWGFLTIVVILISTYKLLKRQFDNSFIFVFAGIAGLFVPFIIDYVIRPSETYRFPAWTMIMFLLFIVISAVRLVQQEASLQKLLKPFAVRVLITIHLLFFLLPGVTSIVPVFGHTPYGANDRLTKPQKNALKEIIKLHRSGEIALASRSFYGGSDIANTAGFYGVGGQLYKMDMTTRRTGVNLMNPILLQELKVNYVLVDKGDVLSEKARERLNNPGLFEEITKIHELNPDWHFYKFVDKVGYDPTQIGLLKSEYDWIVGSKFGIEFKPIVFENNLMYVGEDRKELEGIVKNYKQKLKKDNIPVAMWLVAEAMTKEDLEAVFESQRHQ